MFLWHCFSENNEGGQFFVSCGKLKLAVNDVKTIFNVNTGNEKNLMQGC